jgi:Cdc6-like AAA superfamily ATPase
MDIDERIRQRQRERANRRFVVDYDYLSPVSHVDEPVYRVPLIERLLDHLDPAFAGSLPSNASLWGPKGSGKSAVVSVLFDRLATISTKAQSSIHTATRTDRRALPQFVYVDARGAASRFVLYRALLDGLVDERIPRQGVGIDRIHDRLRTALDREMGGAVVAVDHADEPDMDDEQWPVDVYDEFDNVAWLTVCRDPPDRESQGGVDTEFEVTPYDDKELLDTLLTRASIGLPGESLDHAGARRIAAWAEGDAHDALAALLSATDVAVEAEHNRIQDSDIGAGIESVPRPSVSLGRVFVLSASKQAVLRALVDLDGRDCESVTAASDAITADDSIDLSAGTVKRFLYQLAESGIVKRVPKADTSGKGRPPSRVEPQFPTRAFRRLYDTR